MSSRQDKIEIKVDQDIGQYKNKTLPRQDQDVDQDKTKTRPRQDQDETKARPR